MNLFVANLHPDTNAEGLKTLFSEFGPIVSAKVIFDSATGTSRGFGFVEMADKMQGFDAIDNLDCSFFEGNIISVKEAKQNNTRGGAGGSGGGNRTFNKPRGPRPGGYSNNRDNNFNRDSNYNRGSSFNRDSNFSRDNSYNRDNSFNRDRNNDTNSSNTDRDFNKL